MDDAWHGLLKSTFPLLFKYRISDAEYGPDMNMRVSFGELERLGKSSIELNDGSGDFMVTTGLLFL